jgi:hypothetical protein
MDVLNRKPAFRLLQGVPAGELCLRIVGTARDGQIVRIASPKCTIGSAKGCSLRLRANGVRPMHCLVLCGPRGTVARAWAPNTRLNGHDFTDAPLVDGDRLKVGPIELEVMAVPSDSQSQGSQRVATATAFSSRPEEVQVLRRRVRDLIGSVRGLQAEVQRLRGLAEIQVDESSPDRLALDKPEQHRSNDLKHGI